jgi:hypothetical protein
MGLEDDLRRSAEKAAAFAAPGERVTGALAAEPAEGARVYVYSYEADGRRSWLALDESGEALTSRALVREAVSLVALAELAEEAAGIEAVHPRVATPAYLDSIGTPDLAASLQAVDALLEDVESAYKRELE